MFMKESTSGDWSHAAVKGKGKGLGRGRGRPMLPTAASKMVLGGMTGTQRQRQGYRQAQHAEYGEEEADATAGVSETSSPMYSRYSAAVPPTMRTEAPSRRGTPTTGTALDLERGFFRTGSSRSLLGRHASRASVTSVGAGSEVQTAFGGFSMTTPLPSYERALGSRSIGDFGLDSPLAGTLPRALSGHSRFSSLMSLSADSPKPGSTRIRTDSMQLFEPETPSMAAVTGDDEMGRMLSDLKLEGDEEVMKWIQEPHTRERSDMNSVQMAKFKLVLPVLEKWDDKRLREEESQKQKDYGAMSVALKRGTGERTEEDAAALRFAEAHGAADGSGAAVVAGGVGAGVKRAVVIESRKAATLRALASRAVNRNEWRVGTHVLVKCKPMTYQWFNGYVTQIDSDGNVQVTFYDDCKHMTMTRRYSKMSGDVMLPRQQLTMLLEHRKKLKPGTALGDWTAIQKADAKPETTAKPVVAAAPDFSEAAAAAIAAAIPAQGKGTEEDGGSKKKKKKKTSGAKKSGKSKKSKATAKSKEVSDSKKGKGKKGSKDKGKGSSKTKGAGKSKKGAAKSKSKGRAKK